MTFHLDVIHRFQHCVCANGLIFIAAYKGDECDMEQTSFGCWQLCTLYHTVKTTGITSTMMSLFSCKNPASGPLLRSQNVHLSNPDLDKRVAQGGNINTYPFILDFWIYFVCCYTCGFPWLQCSQAIITILGTQELFHSWCTDPLCGSSKNQQVNINEALEHINNIQYMICNHPLHGLLPLTQQKQRKSAWHIKRRGWNTKMKITYRSLNLSAWDFWSAL